MLGIKSQHNNSSDVRVNWSAVDPLMHIHPNAIGEGELMEERFFIPQGDVLITNKDKELYEQDPHIQAPTIKSKLIGVTRLLDFIEEEEVYIGLNQVQIKHLTVIANSCKRNLSNLFQEREQRLK